MLSNNTTSILRTQYYDDWYEQSDSDPAVLRGDDQDFHRILFRPRYPVQSRELTQMQTILQSQLERYGKSAFKDGEAVLGGALTLDVDAYSGITDVTDNLAAFFNRTTNVGTTVFDTTNEAVRAKVVQFEAGDESASGDGYLIYKLISAGIFSPGTVVQSAADAEVTATFAPGANAEVFSEASVISIDEGVFFVSGFFVRVRKQTLVLSPLTSTPSYRVGLEIAEEILDEQDDIVGEYLLDPANANSPGAHRLRISLTLAKRSINSASDPNFIELARIIDGVLHRAKPAPRFVRIDELNDILARRTHDESGDYIVRPFAPVIQESANTELFVLSLGPGKAYVHGYEVETATPTALSIAKARTSANVQSKTIPLTVGNFVFTVRVLGTVPTLYYGDSFDVDVHAVNVASIVTTNVTTYGYSKIGTTRVRMIEAHDLHANAALHANSSVYKLFFTNTRFDSISGNVVSASQLGTAISIVLPAGPGVPNVAGAIDGVTVILGGVNSPVSGTFTANAYTANSTTGTIQLTEFLPTLPNANTTFRLLFQSKDIDCFARFSAGLTAQAPYTANLMFQAEVDARSKTTGTPVGPTVVSDTLNNGLVFRFPQSFIKANSINTADATFVSWTETSANSIAVTGNTEFTLSISGAGLGLPEGNLTATQAANYLIIFDQTADANGRGRILPFSDTPGTNKCISNVVVSGQNITFIFRNPDTSTRSLVGMAQATITGMAAREKTLIVGNTTHALAGTTGALDAGQIEFHTLNATASFAYSLKTADVYRISKVLYLDSNTAFANTDMSTATDVTSYFSLDTGQRDNTYEYSRLIVGARANRVIRPGGRLLVVFDWFEHSGRGYASVDSYLIPASVTAGMTYDEIPSYTSAKYNRVIELRDVLDFRPVRSNYDFSAAALIYAASDESANTTYLTHAGDPFYIPASDEEWQGDYAYYLARIDKISLGFDGAFRVSQGQPSTEPVAPDDDNGSLLLFQLRVPPYTLVDDDGVPTTVELQTFDHKRYTMQDISKVEDRVAHLEYYTALNSLERITKEQSILDSDGNERFKNGILVDSFQGGGVADIAREDFTASIDVMQRELRTAFRSMNFQFSPDTGHATTTGIAIAGDMAIPTYSTTPFISQPLATHSISVNPFDVASFYGKIELSPAVDIWKSTEGAPAQVIDLGGPTEAWVAANQPSFTNWGEWDLTWSGISAVTHGYLWRGGITENWDDVQSTSIYERQGTAFEHVVHTSTQSMGNRVVDISIIHNARQRDVVFSGYGLKPQSTVYPFFDSVDVLKYVQEANVLRLAPTTNVTPMRIGQTVYVLKPLTGNVAISATSGNISVTGTGTYFQFELNAGDYIRIQQGAVIFEGHIGTISSNTNLSVVGLAIQVGTPAILAAATMSTITPVTIADVATRVDGSNIEYTVKVVRAVRDADDEAAVPYVPCAGSLRPEKNVNDAANTTTGATLIVMPSGLTGNTAYTLNVAAAICKSGVVRSWNSGTGALRFDTDVLDSVANTVGSQVRIVSGPGAGTSANIVSYTAATQTAILDDPALDITAGESIYSIGAMRTDSLIANAVVAAGRAGTIGGCFHLPEAVFPTGRRTFRLTDSSSNNPSLATTAADAAYESSGMTQTVQETIVSSRSLGLRNLGARTETLNVVTTQRENFEIAYVDPLAETFLVDAKIYPQGVMITSVDLCFAQKPTDDIPVTVEIRNVVNGYPSSHELVPCVSAKGLATVSLRPDSVATTALPEFTSLKQTRFTFDAPVHLMPGREYALVVLSDSNEYHVYTAVLGETVVGTTSIVAKQPYAGSFFKSQNASTWSESPFEDLMFRLNRALWTGSVASPQTGILVSRALTPTSNTTFDSFEFYPHDINFSDKTSSSFTLDIKPMNANTEDLTSMIAVRYTAHPNQWRPVNSRSMVQGRDSQSASIPLSRTAAIPNANTVDVISTLVTRSTDVAPFVDLKKMNMVALRHLINPMSLQADDVVIANPGAGYLPDLQTGTLTATATSAVVTGVGTDFVTTIEAGDTVIIGGSLEVEVSSVTNTTSFIATANVGFSRSANTFWTYGDLGGNNVVAVTITDGNGSDAEGYAIIGRDGKVADIVLTDEGSDYTGTPTVSIVAPVAAGGFSVTQTQASLLYTSELSGEGGNGLTRYITRPVTLVDGFDARDLTVLFDAYRPTDAQFHVYYRVMSGDNDTARFDDQLWRPMEMETSNNVVSSHYHQFKEFKFRTPNGRALDATTDTTDRFKVFAVKVVMASTNPVNAPRITNFRAIALDT